MGLTPMLNEELRAQIVASNGSSPKFDGAASYSSLEHSGLGRYGDSLNPWGDLQAMARVWCLLKPRSYMFLGVPSMAKDVLDFNGGRNYGPKRWPHLTANFRQVDWTNQGKK